MRREMTEWLLAMPAWICLPISVIVIGGIFAAGFPGRVVFLMLVVLHNLLKLWRRG